MGIKEKIYINIFLSVLMIGAMYIIVVPKITSSLVALQASHQDQITKLDQLNDEARSLSKMDADLTALEALPVKPEDFFTSDATLVNEIKALEDAAAATNTIMTLSISGTADTALPVPSASGLSQVPYTLSLAGSFPNVVRFISYMQNRFFVSPINGINISINQDNTGVNAAILAQFYIYKPQAAAVNGAKTSAAAPTGDTTTTAPAGNTAATSASTSATSATTSTTTK